MRYVIVDPVSDYAQHIIEFLCSRGLQGIAVFSQEAYVYTFHHLFVEHIGHCFDDEYLVSEHPSVEALAECIRQEWPEPPLTGIIPWDELTINLGAHLGEALGVAWNSREVIRRFRNKWAMKSYLREHSEVRVNRSRVVESEEEALAFVRELGLWPVVAKPAEGAGARSVFFVRNEEELVQRCYQVFDSGNGQVLLEEFVFGTEYVVNGIVDAEQNMLVTDVWRYEKHASHGCENLYYQTIKVGSYEEQFWPLAEYAAAVVEALGVRRAPIHMELKLDEHGPCLIEVGARFAGGNQPLLSSELHGRSLFELAACHYLAELPLRADDISYERYDSRHARIVSGIQSTALERVTEVHGLDEVGQLPSFYMLGRFVPPGAPLPMTVDLGTKSYEVYLVHESLEQIEADAAEVRRLIWYR